MPSLHRLASYDDDGALRVVVETPRNSTVKFTFDTKTESFGITRELMLGLALPYDFGFVPGTLAPDGDPLDAMVLHGSSTYPGTVLACRALGLVALRQKDDGRWIENHRIIAAPAWDGRALRAENVSDLPARIIGELEQFFVNTAYFTSKKLELLGWKPARAAAALIRKSKA